MINVKITIPHYSDTDISIFNFTNEMISTNEKMVKRAKYEVEAHLENNGLGDKMIKDVRSGHESSDVSSVLDGGLDPFLKSYLMINQDPKSSQL